MDGSGWTDALTQADVATAGNASERMIFKTWCQEKAKNHPQFKYWCLVLKLELNVLMFVRSLRSSNFKMYVETLVQLVLCTKPYQLFTLVICACT